MSSLSVIPIEILEWITSVITTSEQMRLWQCGDGILNIKLKNGGLKRSSLGWSRSSWMPWPRWYFTTFDGLQDVEWGVDIGTSLCPTLELNYLPKTLKRLYLACEDVFLVLRIQNVNMNDLLPILQSLRLSGSRLCEENLKNLPSGLIELRVDSTTETIKSSTVFCDLPRSIQRLTLGLLIVDLSEHANDLPSNLVSLDIYRLDCNFNWFSKLPKSLKSLKIRFAFFKPVWDTLPPQLEELKFHKKFATESFPLLPPPLKTLEFFEIIYSTSEDEIISLIPKNLTRLRLNLVGEFLLSHSAIQRLPVTLTDFEFNTSPSHPDILSFFHPQTIRIGLSRGLFSDQLNIFPFPTKLQYLRIHYINDDICAILPPGLQVLHFQDGLITTKGASKLPKSLTSLNAKFKVFDKNESMSYLGHISAIELGADEATVGKLNENWLSSLLPSSPTLNHDCVSSRPDIYGYNYHLTSLAIFGHLQWDKSITIPFAQKPFFASLQNFKTLKTLKICSFEGISNDWLCLIPQSVTDLFVSLSSVPDANQLSTLPMCLKYLNLNFSPFHKLECDWTDEILLSLPRSLNRFWINASVFPNLTQRIYEYLPPNLQFSSLKYKDEDSTLNYIPPLDRLYGPKLN